MSTRYYKNREIAIEAMMFEQGLKFQPLIYTTTPSEDEDGERVLLRDKMDGAGPHLDT